MSNTEQQRAKQSVMQVPTGAPSAKELRRRLFDSIVGNRLVITPLIDMELRLQKNTFTISIGTKFIVMRGTKYAAIDPLEITEDKVEEILEKVELEYNEKIILRPGQMILAGSFEYISLPTDLCAQVGSRSTYGRLALVPATATFIHAGFKGCLTLELVNVGADPVVIRPRMEVAQLIFQYYSDDSEALVTKYKLPTGPEFPKVWADSNLRKLAKFIQSI